MAGPGHPLTGTAVAANVLCCLPHPPPHHPHPWAQQPRPPAAWSWCQSVCLRPSGATTCACLPMLMHACSRHTRTRAPAARVSPGWRVAPRLRGPMHGVGFGVRQMELKWRAGGRGAVQAEAHVGRGRALEKSQYVEKGHRAARLPATTTKVAQNRREPRTHIPVTRYRLRGPRGDIARGLHHARVPFRHNNVGGSSTLRVWLPARLHEVVSLHTSSYCRRGSAAHRSLVCACKARMLAIRVGYAGKTCILQAQNCFAKAYTKFNSLGLLDGCLS
mgnify:CR=1 FL=1